MLFFREYLEISRDSFGCHVQGMILVPLGEARDSAKHLWFARQPHSQEGWALGVNSAEDLTVVQAHVGPITQT